MNVLVYTAALICVAAGLVAGAVAGLTTGDGRLALPIALEFWLAAGLLNLTTAHDWTSLAVAAVVIAVRQTASLALRHSPGASRPGPAGDGRG